MSNFPRYESYKDSGVDWLDKIPAHWEVIRSKRLFQQRTERARNDDEQLTASQKFGVIFQEEFMELEGRRVTQVEFNRNILKHIEPNDFLISMRSFQGGIEFSRYRGCVSSAYVVLTPIKNIVPEFYQYLLKSDSYIRALSSTSNLVRDGQALRFENFTLVDLIIIPKEEQTAIAEFLDRKTAQIEQAIDQKERLIELLKERRQLLIHKAVTRGLNPNVKLKHSGVDWIGEIPEHWEVKPLRHLGKCQNGISKGAEYFGSGFPFVNYSDIYKNPALPEKVDGLAESSKTDREYYSVKEGDIFFTRTSETIEEIGLTSVCMKTIEDATFAGFLIRFRPLTGILNKEFSKYYFRSYMHRDFFVKEMNLVIRASLSQELLKKLPVLIAPVDEQKQIANYLDEKCKKIETAISSKQKEIEKLKEYKAVLINSAVTGKIKVCGNSQNAEVKSNYAKSNE